MSLRACPWPITRLLLHRPPMLLLDEVIGYDDEEAVTRAVIRPDHLFAGPHSVPAHVGIELMAQSCAVFVGAHARAKGLAVRLGFLLGTRRYEADEDGFPIGDVLRITARVVFREDEMGVFDCHIERDGTRIATAQLTVFQPNDVQTVLTKMTASHG
jgi:predicted hotdog family 3-hydroxylacyl-ACP dehydratase